MNEALLGFPDGDLGPLLDLIGAEVVFANLQPGVPDEHVPAPRSPLSRLVGNSGPMIPLVTWTPGEVGLLHAAGQRVARTLADRGHPVPEEWYVAADHPKRGLVLRTYDTPPATVLTWLARAAELLCPFPITEPWRAVVRTR